MIRYRARIWVQKSDGRETTTESLPGQSWEACAKEAIDRVSGELVEDVIQVAVITINKLREK